MKLLSKILNWSSDTLQTKGYGSSRGSYSYHHSYGSSILNLINGQMTAMTAYKYYDGVSAVGNATDIIKQGVGSLDVVVWDRDADKQIDKHPALDLLNAGQQTIVGFLQQLALYYLLTGNAYVWAIYGLKENEPPIALEVLPTEDVEVIGDDRRTEREYRVRDKALVFTKRFVGEGAKRQIRYIATEQQVVQDETGRRQTTDRMLGELLHIKRISPSSQAKGVGVSVMSQKASAIEQFAHANKTNKSILENQGMVAAIISPKEEFAAVPQEAVDAMKEQWHSDFSGSSNSGKALFTSAPIIYTPMTSSMNDMQFAELLNKNEQIIYNCFGVPPQIYSDVSSSYNNVSEASKRLYGSGILPVAKAILRGLSWLLMHYYDNAGQYIFTYDELGIESLQMGRVQTQQMQAEVKKTEATTLKTQADMGVLTINELRAEMGFAPLPDGGDEIAKATPSPTLIPDATASKFLSLTDHMTLSKDDKDEIIAKYEL